MPITQMLFSFDGRIRRRDWWLWQIAVAIAAFILSAIIGGVLGAGAGGASADPTASAAMGGIGGLVVALLAIWPSLALSVKRAHDRNRPAMFIFGYYILYAVFLVAFFVTMGGALAAAGGGATPEAAGLAAGGGGIIMGILGLALFAYAIWLLIELGFLDGTPGPNRFGPSPKGLGGSAEAFA